MKIKYDGNIYAERAVIRAANDYSAIAKVTIASDGRDIKCSFSDCSYDEETTVREFSNYIIGQMNQETKYDNC